MEEGCSGGQGPTWAVALRMTMMMICRDREYSCTVAGE